MKIRRLVKSATEMRKKGYSYAEIHRALSISKSTAYVWLKDVKVGGRGLERLQNKREEAREKGQATNHRKALLRDEQIIENLQSELTGLKLDGPIIKLLCALLYWGEGTKGRGGVGFTNSDPLMVATFLKLFRRGFQLAESRFQATLHLHSYHDEQKQKQFWSEVTGIPLDKIGIYKKQNLGLRKRQDYPGCISIRYNDVSIGCTLQECYKLLAAGGFV